MAIFCRLFLLFSIISLMIARIALSKANNFALHVTLTLSMLLDKAVFTSPNDFTTPDAILIRNLYYLMQYD